MNDAALTEQVARQIAAATGRPFAARAHHATGGGCINRALVLEDDGQRYFVKLNDAARQDMFAAEAEGLAELAAARSLRVPRVICHGVASGKAFLALEHLPLQGLGTRAQIRLGQQLAKLHRVSAPVFGWKRDNTIGSTPQPNAPHSDWLVFWTERRLGHQLQLTGDNALQRAGERLLAVLPAFFQDHRPQPSLLHGDLWGGNVSATDADEPVLYDPAVYYGDRETDLAMTELFGGFSADFYAAYREAWPLDPGYGVRKNLYNLYHVLNHLNLFGGSYGTQAQRMIAQLLAEAR